MVLIRLTGVINGESRLVLGFAIGKEPPPCSPIDTYLPSARASNSSSPIDKEERRRLFFASNPASKGKISDQETQSSKKKRKKKFARMRKQVS
jgi:hypothetical protein